MMTKLTVTHINLYLEEQPLRVVLRVIPEDIPADDAVADIENKRFPVISATCLEVRNERHPSPVQSSLNSLRKNKIR